MEDVPQVYEIEKQSFTNSSWSMEAFYHELEKNEFAHYFVVSLGEEIIAYCGLWLVIDQAQITTIAITSDYRGYGFGQLLLNYVIQFSRNKCDTLSLEVRVENVVAQHVYQKLGFQYGGKRKNYSGEGEDALVMWVNLNE